MSRLFLVLGDQLAIERTALAGGDPGRDRVVMGEVEAEIRRYPNHRQRVALFLAAMRHFRDELRDRGWTLDYQQIDDPEPAADLPELLARAVGEQRPDRVVLTEPGRHDLIDELKQAVAEAAAGASIEVEVEVLPDRTFLCSHEEFEHWAEGRKELTLEYFYRLMRRRHGYLMEDDEPAGGRWNFDRDNRESFGKEGPGEIKEPIHFRPDDTTREVLALVAERFSDLPGSLDAFDWPVTRAEGRRAVLDFVAHRLPRFGTYQDAIAAGRPYLYHSRLGAAINLKLIDPRYAIEKAIDAYRAGDAPLNAVEGFVRQILGWREFIRGVYWLRMPDYIASNELDARRDLPDLYWSGETAMACLRDVVGQLRDRAYAHHIQRLMVSGLFALLYGAEPIQVHEWYMAMYADSVEWVTLPNTLGMSQYGDGGVVGSKPYIASGRYIDRMSDYCGGCRYDPGAATGDDACPFTTLYWDFLARHRDRLRSNRRMGFQLNNLDNKSDEEREEIAAHARTVRRKVREGRA